MLSIFPSDQGAFPPIKTPPDMIEMAHTGVEGGSFQAIRQFSRPAASGNLMVVDHLSIQCARVAGRLKKLILLYCCRQATFAIDIDTGSYYTCTWTAILAIQYLSQFRRMVSDQIKREHVFELVDVCENFKLNKIFINGEPF